MRKTLLDHKIVHWVLVILIFSITGSSVSYLSGLFSSFLGLDKFSLTWWVSTLLIITPLYQVLLLLVAYCFGKFNYFKTKQLKLWKKIKGLFVKS